MDRREFARRSAAVAAGMWLSERGALAAAPGASVAVHGDRPLGLLPMLGLGFSGEKHLIRVGRFYTAANTDFTGLCRRLGPQVLRVGGTHVDHTKWDPRGAGGVDGTISPPDVKAFAEYVRSIGWKVVYGVNLATTAAGATAEEAKYAAEFLGDALLAFEIGNEPDLYVSKHDRAEGYSYEAFRKEWEAYAAAIRAQVPAAPLCGPGAFNHWKEFGLPFAKDEAAKIVMLTQHYYRMSGEKPGATMEALLSGMDDLFDEMKAMVAAAAANRIAYGFRMIETNSFVGGGLPNVSDRMVCGLWAVEYALKAATLGVNGLNFQIGPLHSSNSSLAMGADHPFVQAVRPEFYGIAFVADMGHGRMLQTTMSGAPERVSAYAMQTAAGERNVVLNNLTDQAVGQVRVDTASTATAGELMVFSGEKLLAEDCTLGGSRISTSGQGDAKWTPVDGRAGVFLVDLPQATAVRLRIKAAS